MTVCVDNSAWRMAHGPSSWVMAEGSWLMAKKKLGHPRSLRYTATALPRKRGWLYRATAEVVIALPRYRVFYGTTAALELPVLAFRCLVARQVWPAGFCVASTAAHLPRYRAFRAFCYRATEPRGIPRTALPQACGSTTAGDLGFLFSRFAY